jgi:uncharacterized membrane protein
MSFDLLEWLNLAVRWLHITCAIAWIGSSFYFVWLDLHLTKPKAGDASGELWSVHGGGFYHNQKYLVAPAQMPDDLHWFKWEAYFTWISGFGLLGLVYYVGAQSFLMAPEKVSWPPAAAIACGLGALVAAWVVYDGLCRAKPCRDNRVLGAVWFGVLLGAAYGLNLVFPARAMYLHIGAMVGTVMAGNVFFIIIPNQRKVVADLVAGRSPDPALGAQAKQRSLHNNYMTLPVLFIMMSHHYPMTFGADRPWAVLGLLGATGVAVRHVFNLRHVGKPTGAAMAVAGALALVSVTYVSVEKAGRVGAGGTASFADVKPIIAKHCLACHAERPTNPAFASPPLGVVLGTCGKVAAAAPRIKRVAADSEVMPLGNLTGITKAERQKLGAWIAGGALCDNANEGTTP